MADSIRVEEVTEVLDELAEVMDRLVPQLSRSSPPPSADEVEEIVRSPACHLLLARDAGGTVVGMLTLAVFRIPTGLRAWIEDVVVDEGARGKGVGAELTNAAIRLGRGTRRSHGRSHLAAVARGGEPALPAARVRGARDQRVPLRPRRL
jgi:GNAT superfamily N-acetyltransferase